MLTLTGSIMSQSDSLHTKAIYADGDGVVQSHHKYDEIELRKSSKTISVYQDGKKLPGFSATSTAVIEDEKIYIIDDYGYDLAILITISVKERDEIVTFINGE